MEFENLKPNGPVDRYICIRWEISGIEGILEQARDVDAKQKFEIVFVVEGVARHATFVELFRWLETLPEC